MYYIDITFSVYIGYYLNSMLISNMDITFEFAEILKTLTDSKILSLIVCIQALFMMLFYAHFTSKYGIYKANTEMITTNISIPKHYGQGQYGTSRFATNKEFDRTYTRLKFNKNQDYLSQSISNGGIVVKHNSKRGYEEISLVSDNKHLICLGNTGAGKTRRILIESLCTLGLAGESIIVSDPKGELYQMTSQFFNKLGYEVDVIDFKTLKKSNKYNFLQPIINAIQNDDIKRAEDLTWDLVENIVQKQILIQILYGKMEKKYYSR